MRQGRRRSLEKDRDFGGDYVVGSALDCGYWNEAPHPLHLNTISSRVSFRKSLAMDAYLFEVAWEVANKGGH